MLEDIQKTYYTKWVPKIFINALKLVEILQKFQEIPRKISNWEPIISYVPEVLYVHTNEIYKKLTTIKFKKLKFKKVLNKITFSFSKVHHFSLLEKKILLKK